RLQEDRALSSVAVGTVELVGVGCVCVGVSDKLAFGVLVGMSSQFPSPLRQG
ncbi:hypothetical protein LCGC14_1647120, partial [marine sediment metagenome]